MIPLPISRTFCQFPPPSPSYTFKPLPVQARTKSMSTRPLRILMFCILLYSGSARAQGPIAAGAGPSMNVSLGPSYVSMGMNSSSRVALNGLDAGAEVGFLTRIGIKLDAGYARAWNVFGSGRHSDILDYLGGPIVHISRRKAFAAYLQGLVGGARITGPVPLAGVKFGTGYANKLAWGAGLGAEHRFSDGLAFRVGGDYLHTAFFSSSGTLQGQTDFRTVASIVYYFRGGSERNSRF